MIKQMYQVNILKKQDGTIDVRYNGKLYQVLRHYTDEILAILKDPNNAGVFKQPDNPNQTKLDFSDNQS